MNRNLITLFAIIVTLSATIFYFINNDRATAMLALFIGIYITVGLYILLRILFYFRYKATINELFYVLYFNVVATVLILLEPLVPLSSEKHFNIAISIGSNQSVPLYITLVSIMAFPYFLFSTILQVRSFTKYEFYRLSPTAEKGFKAEWVALIVYFIFGIIFIFAAQTCSAHLSLIIGKYFIFNRFEYFLAK